MLVEVGGGLVFGIDDEREDCRFGAHCAADSIDDQAGAEALSAKLLIDGKASDKAGRERGIAGQAPRLVGQELAERQAGRGEGVIGCHSASGVNGDKAIADPATHVLCRKLAKIAVEGGNATGKGGSVVRRSETLDPKAVSQQRP